MLSICVCTQVILFIQKPCRDLIQFPRWAFAFCSWFGLDLEKQLRYLVCIQQWSVALLRTASCSRNVVLCGGAGSNSSALGTEDMAHGPLLRPCSPDGFWWYWAGWWQGSTWWASSEWIPQALFLGVFKNTSNAFNFHLISVLSVALSGSCYSL